MHKKRKKKAPDHPSSPWIKTQFANLLRYKTSGTLFAHFKARGKLVRRSLETHDIEVGKRKLDDLMTRERGAIESRRDGKFTVTEAIDEFRQRGYRIPIAGRKRKAKPLKDRTRAYYEERITALLKAWPDLPKQTIRKISAKDCDIWAAKFQNEVCASAYNHTISVLQQILQVGVEAGARHDNPALNLGRASEKPKKLILPSPDQFRAFLEEIQNSGARYSKGCAYLVQFLAYGGFRLREAANVQWRDCDLNAGTIMIWGDPENRTKNGEFRRIPMIQEMRLMLQDLHTQVGTPNPTDPVMPVRECQKAMTRAAKVVKMPRITHHDLRHLFATRCIESGVDIPTVSRWLGHKDGGALAMKVYGHLRDQHSAEMASKVTFGSKPATTSPPQAAATSQATPKL